ncbi:MAG: imidazole glycerol phosphate synthase subunit HisH [Desulfarculaceae bacterium]
MIAIVDYEAGNLTSVQRAVNSLGEECLITQDPQELDRAERIIFPGVGAAGASMNNIRRLGLDAALKAAVSQNKPVLGICVGAQIVFDFSEEDSTSCLGLLPGKAARFPLDFRDGQGRRLKVPHMGWNGVNWQRPHPVFADIPKEAEFYFVHSFYPEPSEAADVVGTCDYGMEFAAAVARGSLVVVQFHAEKSGRPGLKVLQNFIKWDGRE